MIHVVSETGSTNRDLAARLASGDHVPEGEWLVADRQTDGVGRSGRNWIDGAGNFMGSTLVHRRFADPPVPTLALVAGLAVFEAVSRALAARSSCGSRVEQELFPTPSMLSLSKHSSSPSLGPGNAPEKKDNPSTGSGSTGSEDWDMRFRLQLKWPNDLLVGSAKLAGILLEREGDAVIIGIGVNLACAPALDGRETISLEQLGARLDRDRFAQSLASQFDLDLQRWRDFGLAPIIRRWLAAAHPEGTPLIVDDGERRLDGRFAGLADDGALRLRLNDGSMRDIRSGEVRLLDQVRG